MSFILTSHYHSFFIFSILIFELNIPEASCSISQFFHLLLSPVLLCPFRNFYPFFLPLLLTILSCCSLYPHVTSSFLHSHSCPTSLSPMFSSHPHLKLASVPWLQKEITGKSSSRCSHRTDLGMIQPRGSRISRRG